MPQMLHPPPIQPQSRDGRVKNGPAPWPGSRGRIRASRHIEAHRLPKSLPLGGDTRILSEAASLRSPAVLRALQVGAMCPLSSPTHSFGR